VLILATLVIAAAIYLMVRRVEIRLVLLGAGLVMCLLAGEPLALADTFTRGMVTSMVAPICAAMGFAAVMSATGCDKHLVHLLLAPIRSIRWLALPGGILVAYLVNMAVPSQTSTAAALGPILVPLLLASGYAPVVAGAALILGASYGGDLLNPGSQDVQAIAGVVRLSAPELSARVIPASIAGALVAAFVFAVFNRPGEAPPPGEPVEEEPETGLMHAPPPETAEFRLDPLRAAIPLVPVALLLAAYGGFAPLGWLVRTPPGDDWAALANALPVVRAMLIGTLMAVVVAWREVQALTRTFFDGMGAAYASIISLTITAQCFGAGIAAMGVADALLDAAHRSGSLTLLAGAFPWALSVLSGSGSGPVLTFAQTFLAHMDVAADTVRLSAMTCFGGAFGRTMSPVAAVVVYTAGLVGVSPVLLIRQFLPALAAGASVTFAVAAR
jgi:DcuC family C4-dicarboxylate transporter